MELAEISNLIRPFVSLNSRERNLLELRSRDCSLDSSPGIKFIPDFLLLLRRTFIRKVSDGELSAATPAKYIISISVRAEPSGDREVRGNVRTRGVHVGRRRSRCQNVNLMKQHV